MNDEIVYFELNNWRPGEDYPDASPYKEWLNNDVNQQFLNESWVKENGIVVTASLLDMSYNFEIAAPKSWVERNCPTLLTDYREFLRHPDEDGNVYGRCAKFVEYSPENIGVHWWYGDE